MTTSLTKVKEGVNILEKQGNHKSKTYKQIHKIQKEENISIMDKRKNKKDEEEIKSTGKQSLKWQ